MLSAICESAATRHPDKRTPARIRLHCAKTIPASPNSKCLRCLCEDNNIQVQLEINVADCCENQPLSSAQFSGEHNLTGRIIRIMRLDVALAHKIAAWNEQGLLRDLYDCYYLVDILGIMPHLDTLNLRLHSALIRSGSKSKRLSMSLDDLKKNFQEPSRPYPADPGRRG